MVGLCRLCASLKKADLLINIKNQTNEICQKLQKCCRVIIEMNDVMPKSVCQSCLDQLNLSYNFYAKVHEAQETLKALFPDNRLSDRRINDDALVLGDVSPPNDSPTRTTKQSPPVEKPETIEGRRQKKSLRKIKIENWDVETQETLGTLFPSPLGDKCNGVVDDSAVKVTPTSSSTCKQSTTAEKEQIIEPVKHQKNSHHKIKFERGDMGHAKQETDTRDSDSVFTIATIVSENEDDSNGDNGDNDGYLQEVYSILGMTHDDVGDHGPTPEEHERMDFLVTTFSKEEQDQIITQEDHFFPDGEEQHLIEDEDLMAEEQNGKVLEATEGNMQLEEIVLDERYPDEEIDLDYEELEEDSSYMANEDTDTTFSSVGNEDRKKNYSSIPLEMQITSWNAYKHLCYACDYRASSFKDLIGHAADMHSVSDSNKLQYKCYDCQKVIGHYNDFLNHVRLKHHPALKLRCDACDMLCTDYKQYELHRDINCLEAKTFPTNLTCSYCCKTFRSTLGQQIHVRQHLEGNPTVILECKVCFRKFLSKTALNQHEKMHTTKTLAFSCEHCEKSFTSKGALDVHLSTHVNKRLHRCHVCHKDFKTHTYLEKHQIVHTDQRPFHCSYCPRQFRTKIEQTTHERIHTGEMPLQCNHCDKRFRFRSALSAHLKTHSGIRSHTCKYCSRQFNDKSNFKKHIRRKHAEEESNEIIGDVE